MSSPTNFFGTDGIRNRVGRFPFTTEMLPKLGRALALWAQEKYGNDACFLVARDTRYSGPWIKAGLMNGLLREPITVYDAGILPTPGVYHLLNNDTRFTGGIIISASHNPATDNGIKLVDARLGKLSERDEIRICELMKTAEPNEFTKLGTEIPLNDARLLYRKTITRLFPNDFLAGKTIVLDCANGANSTIAPQIFKDLGAQVVAIHHTPDGYNINKNCGATDVLSLQQAVLKHKAFIGFAFDGDGDRVIAVNKEGTIKDGDDMVAILRTHAQYAHEPAVVSTVMANHGLVVHLASHNKELHRTAVGDKYVLNELEKMNLSVGGEPSGHIILKDSIKTGDGILVALKLLETIAQTNNEYLESFTKMPQVSLTIPIKVKKDLSTGPLAEHIAASKQQLPHGRVLVRYSGTEPVVRVMAEGEDLEYTKAIAQQLADHLQQNLG
jgi:phosphoglucosamine mutase